MLMDAGILTVYEVKSINDGGIPAKGLAKKFDAWYSELGIGTEEWNAQAARDKTPVGRVRIWQDKRAVTGNIIVFPDGTMCKAGRVWHGNDIQYVRGSDRNEGLPITDITLEKPDQTYKIPEGSP